MVGFSFTDPGDRFFEIAKNLDIYATLFKELNYYYVDEINPNKLMKSSIVHTLKELDPYTNYYAEDDIEDFMTLSSGQYNGIGAVVLPVNGKQTVMSIFDDSPAQKANLKVGDAILKIDGETLENQKEIDLNRLLKGQNGTNLKLQILRYGEKKPQDVTVTRGIVKIESVPYYGMINETVGYINLTEFSGTAAKEVKSAFNDLKAKGMKQLIFDLRENGGGLLNMAVEICNMFIPKDAEIVSTKGKVAEWNKLYKATMAPVDLEIPIAVLINNHSASASEIVAGVIQDYDRGVLVGQRSYGKGLVQVTRDLTYNCKLKVTTAKYYIPSGRCIQAIDYSNRNADGSVGTVPDSLMKAFKTKNNRKVMDGGGVNPDIVIANADLAQVTNSLLQNNYIFEYANKFLFEKKEIEPAKTFEINDAEYLKFVNWLKDKNINYESALEKNIKTLEKTAKSEKYFEAIQDQIVALKTKVENQRKNDLITFKKEIKLKLEQQIIANKYLQKGLREASFEKDEEMKEALKILANKTKYNAILNKN